MDGYLESFDYKGTPSKAMFKALLYDEPCFESISGHYTVMLHITKSGSYYSYDMANFPMYESNFYLYMEDGKPKGFIAFKEDRMDFHRKEISVLHLLYVSREYARQGVGSRILQKLKSMADKVDHHCKTKEKWEGTSTIGEPFFSICAFPNIFEFLPDKELDLQSVYDGTSNVDFTLPIEIDKEHDIGLIHPEEHLYDQTYGELKFESRMNQVNLREFYERNDFVQTESMFASHPIFEGMIRRELQVSAGTFCNLNKYPLLYPDNNQYMVAIDERLKGMSGKTIGITERNKFNAVVLEECLEITKNTKQRVIV